MDQFLDESIATCTASDGTVFLSPSSGVPPGLSCSTNMFVDIYGEASEEYENNIKLETNMVMASSLNYDNQMWRDKSSIRFKINIFMSATISVLLSGLVSFAIRGKRAKKLETTYHKM